MTIPDYQSIMLPLLEIVSNDKEHNIREIIDRLAEKFQLGDEERRELLPSGRQAAFDNRVGWARTYLKKRRNGGRLLVYRFFLHGSFILPA